MTSLFPRTRRGFTLIEVMAAFVIALLMIAPVTAIIGGVAGSFGGIERSVARRTELQMATIAAATLQPLRPGDREVGALLISVEPRPGPEAEDLKTAGWQLLTVTARRAAQPSVVVLETVRIAPL